MASAGATYGSRNKSIEKCLSTNNLSSLDRPRSDWRFVILQLMQLIKTN